MAKRLSDNPETIRNQIEISEGFIKTYKKDLERTPQEDIHGKSCLKRELNAEEGTLGRLRRHLNGLEDAFDGMFEATKLRAQYEPEYDL